MKSLCLFVLTIVALMMQVSATPTYASIKSIENQPCTTFGAYRCEGTSLFQCGYTTGNKLVWRLLWDCGSDLTCTVVPGGFVGCTAPAYEKLTKEKEEYYEEEYDECSADYKFEDKHCQYGDCAAKYTRSVCKFGAWRCKGNAVQQCGYVAGNDDILRDGKAREDGDHFQAAAKLGHTEAALQLSNVNAHALWGMDAVSFEAKIYYFKPPQIRDTTLSILPFEVLTLVFQWLRPKQCILLRSTSRHILALLENCFDKMLFHGPRAFQVAYIETRLHEIHKVGFFEQKIV
ncbi:hypothetical protein BJ741DRAFT_714159 [Chytriomyces cf. hyalinus JEL632]|nr:hypothetical protein BJ741DRAFT_714159 [Chytriomyces cf. hyalinus JEL632]